MSDDNFIARWSRLKRQTAAETEKKSGEPATTPDIRDAVNSVGTEMRDAERAGAAEQPEFDLSSLPPIEDITAGTDIRAFLQSGVPAELTKAALRRAWTADPAIRDFIGLAENQWDFTNLSSIPGFGPLGPGDDVRQLVAGALGRLDELAAAAEPIAGNAPQQAERGKMGATSEPEASAQTAGIQQEMQQGAPSHGQVKQQNESDSSAAQNVDAQPEMQLIRNRRSHGGAIPQ
jgi:hypothetical protein